MATPPFGEVGPDLVIKLLPNLKPEIITKDQKIVLEFITKDQKIVQEFSRVSKPWYPNLHIQTSIGSIIDIWR